MKDKPCLLVSGVSLWVAPVVVAILVTLDAHLEPSVLRRAEAVRPGWRGKSLILVPAVLRWIVGLLRIRRLLLAVTLLGIMVVAALRLVVLAVSIVRS